MEAIPKRLMLFTVYVLSAFFGAQAVGGSTSLVNNDISIFLLLLFYSKSAFNLVIHKMLVFKSNKLMYLGKMSFNEGINWMKIYSKVYLK